MPQDDGEKPRTFWQDMRAAEFWLLLVVSMCSMLGLTWWLVVPLGILGLLISSMPKYVPLWRRAVDANAHLAWVATVASSIIISITAVVAAVVFGRLAGWMWGVG